ncbi:lipopolysaccharide assembly protein LapA domain-containing protein [Desemzia sp. FAM 23991]|uniref:LapA family protein n=1 Tax=unclassified Desemzia TaxID=2685243 RepID=UPI003889CA24
MIVLAIILLILVGVVAFLNMGMVPLDLYFISFQIPFWLLVAGLVLIGMAIAGLFAASKGARNRQMLKNKKEELEHAETSKDEAVDRVRKESEAQLEIQIKEAEIQKLNERLTTLERNQSNTEKPPSQTVSQGNSANAQKVEPDNVDVVRVEEYQVDPSKKKKSTR